MITHNHKKTNGYEISEQGKVDKRRKNSFFLNTDNGIQLVFRPKEHTYDGTHESNGKIGKSKCQPNRDHKILPAVSYTNP